MIRLLNNRYLCSLVVACLSIIDLAAQTNSLAAEIREENHGISVWWAGHNSWLVKSGELLISTDLMLDTVNRIAPLPVTTGEIARDLDISFITHGHGDHFHRQTTATLVAQSQCLFVMPENCRDIARELKIPEERIVLAKPGVAFEIKGVKVQPLRAIHGDDNFAIYIEANLQDCGYLIDLDGTTFLQPGDSYLLEDHLFLDHVDVLFFSPTEHNTYIDRSVILINTLNPDYILPQHHSTMKVTPATRFWAKGYPEEVKLRLSKALQKRFHILEPGERISIESGE